MRSLWIVVVIAALVLGGMIGGAAQAQDDSTFNALRNAGLIQDLNLTDTADGVTITLDWAYADVNLFAVHLTVAGLASEVVNAEAPLFFPTILLSDTDSNQFSPASSGFEKTADSNGTITLQTLTTFYTEALRPGDGGWTLDKDYFTNRFGGSLPNTLDLRLSITIDQMPSSANATAVRIGPFDFDFTVPLYPAVTLQPAQSQTANGVQMTLERVSVTPSQTAVTFCFDLPDGSDWQPVASLTLGSVTVQPSGWGMAALQDGRRCFDMRFTAFYNRAPQTLILTVDRLRTSEPETREYWEQVKGHLLAYGIEIEIVLAEGVYYQVISRPEGMTDQEFAAIMQEVRESLRPTTEGPWVFTVQLP